jgi:hypothetical protein
MYNIVNGVQTPVSSLASWLEQYGDQQVEYSHDQSMLTLAHPDDSLLVVGPPRLAGAADGEFTIIGFLNSLNYDETSTVHPIKAIGSRRHIFSKTNSPVTGSITRMMILGANLVRVLYSRVDLSTMSESIKRWSGNEKNDGTWFTNIEEDIFRIPFGLGVIYNSPGSRIVGSSGASLGAEYIESCVLQGKRNMITSGETMILENVSFIADRVMTWATYSNALSYTNANPLAAFT